MPEKEEMFYISNRKPVGNCMLWWCEDGHGYTCDLRKAWKVNREKAESICKERPEIDKMWPANAVIKVSKLHVDWQDLRDEVEINWTK